MSSTVHTLESIANIHKYSPYITAKYPILLSFSGLCVIGALIVLGIIVGEDLKYYSNTQGITVMFAIVLVLLYAGYTTNNYGLILGSGILAALCIVFAIPAYMSAYHQMAGACSNLHNNPALLSEAQLAYKGSPGAPIISVIPRADDGSVCAGVIYGTDNVSRNLHLFVLILHSIGTGVLCLAVVIIVFLELYKGIIPTAKIKEEIFHSLILLGTQTKGDHSDTLHRNLDTLATINTDTKKSQ